MLHRLLKSFSYAFKGIKNLLQSQPNAKIHLLAAFLAISTGFLLGISANEWGLLIISICLVFAAEALNTGLEYLTDLASPEFHPLAGKAKDAGAAAVLITAFGAVGIGVVVFGPKLMGLLTG
jgi:diacylglycerol kinase